MTDQYLASGLRTWLKDTEARPEDARRSTDKVMARVDEAGQRGRWWPLPASDRPVSTISSRELAPAPIPATDGRQPTRGFTMFSALKFVVAGVIVALFGGFLLAVVLTTQQEGEVLPATVTESPSPMMTEELLSGMVTEEIEPGVFRILGDGVRHFPDGSIVAGQDDSLWLVHEEDGFVRLGSPDDEPHTFPEGSWDRRPVVGPDGTFWVSDTRPGSTEGADEITRIHSLEDGSWTVRAQAPDMESWTIASDGTVWAAYREDGNVVARLGAGGWEPLEDPPSRRGLVVTQSGEVWVGTWLGQYTHRHDDGAWPLHEGGSVWRYREDDGAWHEVTVDAMVHDPANQRVEVGPDGTVWFAGYEPLIVDGEPVPDPDSDLDLMMPMPGDPFLMRFDGTEWQRWGPADGIPPLGEVSGITLMPTPDGGLWLAPLPLDTPCSEHWGIARFDDDGPTWRHFLSGHCIWEADLAQASDGAVWLTTPTEDDDDPRDDLYVITPEAVAATE